MQKKPEFSRMTANKSKKRSLLASLFRLFLVHCKLGLDSVCFADWTEFLEELGLGMRLKVIEALPLFNEHHALWIIYANEKIIHYIALVGTGTVYKALVAENLVKILHVGRFARKETVANNHI